MNIEDIDRYCDQFEARLKRGDAISADSFIREQHLPDDALLGMELRRVEQEYGKSSHLHSTVTYQTIEPTVSDRYSPLKFHARGGVGEVWIAEDGEIGRQVALKKLSRYEEGSNERFLAEAQIAGQLEHPSVVPVHDVGIDRSGKPYYVMKFVHGRTLRDAIEEYHGASNAGKSQLSEEERSLHQQRLLHHFIDVCEAVAFAHTRGVVHRDIKPSNVMLGLFGETIVLDWGLAKVLNQPELPGLPTAVTSSGRSSDTAQGSVLGTPAYMPPEIAEGKAADAGPSVDVYLLGATLYEILTGSPPRRGSSRDEIVELARTVAPVPPREKNRHVARPLEAICQKAMAKHERDRYGSALDVAEDIRRYLAGAPVSAYPEPLPARLWRWTKKNRRGLIRGATAAVIAAILIVAVEASVHRRQLWAKQQAREQIDSFRQHYDDAMFFVGQESEVIEGNAQFAYFDPDSGHEALQNALILAEPWGENLASLTIDDEERGALRRELYELQLLRAQLAQLHPRPDRPDEFSDALARAESYQYGTPSLDRLRSGGGIDAVGDAISTSDFYFDHFLAGEQLRTRSIAAGGGRRVQLEAAIEHYRSALRLKPEHYWSRLQLGRCLVALGRNEEAIGTLGACAALRTEVPWALSARSIALMQEERYDEALADLDKVLTDDPSFHPARLNRGVVLWRQGNLAEATGDFQSVLIAEDNPLILAAFYLGQMSLQQGELGDALQYFRQFANGNQLKSFRLAHLSIAKTHYLRGEQDLGLESLNRALQLSAPDSFQPDGLLSRFKRGWYLRQWATSVAVDLVAKSRLRFGEGSKEEVRAENTRRNILQSARQELLAVESSFNRAPLPDKFKLDTYLELATVYEKLDDPENAEQTFSQGLAIDPDHFRLTYKRGHQRYLRNAYGLAQQDFIRAAGLNPQRTGDKIYVAAAHSYSGILFALDENTEEAHRRAGLSAAELFDIAPPHPLTFQVLHNIACIYGGLSQLEDAEQDREKLQIVAINYVDRALDKAREAGRLATEIDDIQKENEGLFGADLKAHPKFKALLRKALADLGANETK